MDKNETNGTFRKHIAFEVMVVEGELAKQVLALREIRSKLEKRKESADAKRLHNGMNRIVDGLNLLEKFQTTNSDKIASTENPL